MKKVAFWLVSGVMVSSLAFGATPESPAGSGGLQLDLDASGRVTVRDASGQTLRQEPMQGPLKATEILSVRTITLVEARGSHFYVMCDPFGCYKVWLPH